MNNTLRFLLVGAITLAATSAAFAQNRMAANIGFPFKMQSATMPAGNYELVPSTSSGSKYFTLRAANGHNTVIVSPRYVIDDRSTKYANRLVFKCDSHMCALAEIWTPGGAGYATPRPKLSPAEHERLAVVPLTVPKAD